MKNYRETDTHIYFYGSFMSNWYSAPFTIDYVEYDTVEQYFMTKKAIIFKDWDTWAKMMATDDPAEVKRLGRQVKGYDDEKWNEVRYAIMVEGVYNKFKQNRHLENALLGTTHKINNNTSIFKNLVEASPTDVIWGVGLSQNDDRILDKKNWRGQNLLGLALEDVRNRLAYD